MAVKRIEGYANIASMVLLKQSIAQNISHKGITFSEGQNLKVYIHGEGDVQDYVLGTGVTPSVDGGAYVTITNAKDKAINEILDAGELAMSPVDYPTDRYVASIKSFGKQIDTDFFAAAVSEGTEAFAAAIAKTDATTIMDRVIALMVALDTAEADHDGRALTITPTMHGYMLQSDKIVLQEPTSKLELVNGSIGRLLGFDIFVSNRLPAGSNMVATQEEGIVSVFNHKGDAKIVSLDGSDSYVDDFAVKQRNIYNQGVIRTTLVQVDNSAA